MVIGLTPNGLLTDSPGFASIATRASVNLLGHFIPASTASYSLKSQSKRAEGILLTSDIENPQAPRELFILTPFIILPHSSQSNGL
jgi:hypothetical protein